MLDKEVEQEILKEVRKVKFGKVTINLVENSNHVDIKTEKTKRIYKKKSSLDYDKMNILHEG